MMRYLLFAIMILSISCSKRELIDKDSSVTDPEIGSPSSKKCYLLKYGVPSYSSDGTKYFPTEFHYEQNRIIRRSEYAFWALGSNQLTVFLVGEVDILYNKDKLPVKIIGPNNSAEEIEEEILYDGQKRMINKIKKTKTGYTVKTNHFTYSYDSKNRISSYIENVYNSLDSTSSTFTYKVVYSDDENLESVTRTNVRKEGVYTNVTTYRNYDSNKNPLQNINVPFDDVILLRTSKNNFREVKSVLLFNDIPTGSGSTTSINFTEYNENNFPAVWEYWCD